jgi:hypothetical protein
MSGKFFALPDRSGLIPLPVLLESTLFTGFHTIIFNIRLEPNVRLRIADHTEVAGRKHADPKNLVRHNRHHCIARRFACDGTCGRDSHGRRSLRTKGCRSVRVRKVQTFSGVLTDAHCGARHPSKSHLSAGDCVRMCLKQGFAWALMDGERIYTLKGDSPVLDRLAGERVSVSGTLEGNTIHVQSVESQNR